MTNLLSIAGQTDVGRHRKDNQDTFISQPLWSEQNALLVVIDGVGGYAGGAEAAAIAKEAIEHYMASPRGDTLTMLQEAVVHANNQIVARKEQQPALARMCCVLTAAVADTEAQKLFYAHVGDTRLYRFREGALTKLTHDHSLVGVREDANQLTEREAMKHPRRNEILRDVGSLPHRVDDPDFLESGETDFKAGDGLLLCSDGLTDMITREQIIGVLRGPGSAEEQVADLIRLANRQGGQDNITVVMARYPEGAGEKAAPTETPPAGGKISPFPQPVPLPEVDQPDISLPAAPPDPPRKSTRRVVPLMILTVIALAAAITWWQFVAPPPDPAPVAPPVYGGSDTAGVAAPPTGQGLGPDTTLIDLTIPKKSDSLNKP